MGLKIGLVLSRVPNYSETFFLNKIKGLQASGFEVTLFAQHSDSQFLLCPIVLSPSISDKHSVKQVFKFLFVILHLVASYPKRVFNFVKIERKSNRTWFQLLKNLYTNSHLLKANLDWVHFGFATIALQSEHVAKAIGSKMAVSIRGFDIDVYPQQQPHCYDLLWQHVDKVHSISNYLLKKAYQLGLSPEQPFRIITPAVDVSLFSSKRHQFSKSKIGIITVARLHKIKDIKSAINTMKILKNHAVDFEYVIIGDGPEHDNLLNQIQALKLENEVKLIGVKEPKVVAESLKQADIYVQYSESEGFCNAVLEAQSVGLLCVVSDGGALPENVLHGKTGWVVPKKNPELLAQAIMNVIHLPDSAKKQFSTAAEERVKNEFNLNKQQQLFEAFYEHD